MALPLGVIDKPRSSKALQLKPSGIMIPFPEATMCKFFCCFLCCASRCQR
jgi:hypothetical protein